MAVSSTHAISGSVWQRWALPVYTLALRELQRFFRQRSRMIGAIGQPLIFWILFGAGFSSMRFAGAEGTTFQAYFLPGILLLIVLFTSIFSNISVIQDRNEGFLQGVLVAPVPRTALVLGKLCGGTLLALMQAVLFLSLTIVMEQTGLVKGLPPLTPLALGGGLAFLALTAFGLTAFGFLFAWRLDSIQGFHAIMSVLLMPMWLVSGAFFPTPATGWLRYVVLANPLTYGLAGMRRLMAGDAAAAGLPSLPTALLVSTAFALLCLTGAVWMTRRYRTA